MSSFFALNRYLAPYKLPLLLGVVFIVFSKIFALFPARIISKSFDEITRILELNLATEALIEKALPVVGTYGLYIVGAALINGFFLFLTRQTIIVVSRKVEFDLKNKLYRHYQALPVQFYKQNNTGDMMNRISEDISRIRMYFGPAIMYSINLVVLFILVISTMVSIHPLLSLYCLTPLPFLALTIYFVSRTIHKKSEKVQGQLSNLSTYTQETFAGIRVIKAFDIEKRRISSFITESETYKTYALSLAKTNALFHPFMILLIGLSTIATIYIGGKLTIKGEVSTGNIAEFVIYVNMLTWPVASLGWVTSLTQRALASFKRVNAFLQHPIKDQSSKSLSPFTFGDISISNASYTYPETGIKALDNISLNIPKGSSLGIVGKTGSGKSTLLEILSKTIAFDTGTLCIDHTNYTELSDAELRDHIGYVPQDVFLFSDTIEENIGFGLLDSQDKNKRVIQVAQKACIHTEIEQLPKGYQTLLGERGVNLSGGQKQRISIARGLIKNPHILLFDDCLSAVDTKTEQSILQMILSKNNQQTLCMISQRIAGVKHCDQIIVLDQGKIIQQGTHDQLKKQDGFYKTLAEKEKRQFSKKLFKF